MRQRIMFLLLGIICALGTMTAHAQSSYELKRGYTGSVEGIAGFLDFGVSTTHGYRVNKYFSFGGNTGVQLAWSGVIVPICAVAQFDLPVHKHTSFFLNAKSGLLYSVPCEWIVDEEYGGRFGHNFNLGVGFRYRCITLQYAVNLVVLDYEKRYAYMNPQLRLGFTFGAR